MGGEILDNLQGGHQEFIYVEGTTGKFKLTTLGGW